MSVSTTKQYISCLDTQYILSNRLEEIYGTQYIYSSDATLDIQLELTKVVDSDLDLALYILKPQIYQNKNSKTSGKDYTIRIDKISQNNFEVKNLNNSYFFEAEENKELILPLESWVDLSTTQVIQMYIPQRGRYYPFEGSLEIEYTIDPYNTSNVSLPRQVRTFKFSEILFTQSNEKTIYNPVNVFPNNNFINKETDENFHFTFSGEKTKTVAMEIFDENNNKIYPSVRETLNQSYLLPFELENYVYNKEMVNLSLHPTEIPKNNPATYLENGKQYTWHSIMSKYNIQEENKVKEEKYISYIPSDSLAQNMEELAYIESTGTKIGEFPIIDTGLRPTDTTKIQIDFQGESYGGALIGTEIFNSQGQYVWNESQCFRICNVNTGWYLDYGSGYEGNRIYNTTGYNNTKRYKIEIGNRYVKDLETENYYLYNEQKVSFPTDLYTNLRIGETFQGKIYGIKIYRNDILVRNYIPAKKKGIVGLFDKINEEFVSSEVQGYDFKAGSLVSGISSLRKIDKFYPLEEITYNYLPNLVEWNGNSERKTEEFKLYFTYNNLNNIYSLIAYDDSGTEQILFANIQPTQDYKFEFKIKNQMVNNNDLIIIDIKKILISSQTEQTAQFSYAIDTLPINFLSILDMKTDLPIYKSETDRQLNLNFYLTLDKIEDEEIEMTYDSLKVKRIEYNRLEEGIFSKLYPYENILNSILGYLNENSKVFYEIRKPNQRLLPIEYQEVEWIQKSGNTSWINTNYYPCENTKVKAKFNIQGNGSGFYGTTADASGNFNFTAALTNTGGNWRLGNKSINITGYLNGIHESIQDKNGIIIDGVSKGTYGTISPFRSTIPIDLFRLYDGTTSAIIRFYYVQIYEEDNIVRDFVPCYRKIDNVIGMYDLVNNIFYTNGGTGTFTKGDKIASYSLLKSEYKYTTQFDLYPKFESDDYFFPVLSSPEITYTVNGLVLEPMPFFPIPTYGLSIPINYTYLTSNYIHPQNIPLKYYNIRLIGLLASGEKILAKKEKIFSSKIEFDYEGLVPTEDEEGVIIAQYVLQVETVNMENQKTLAEIWINVNYSQVNLEAELQLENIEEKNAAKINLVIPNIDSNIKEYVITRRQTNDPSDVFPDKVFEILSNQINVGNNIFYDYGVKSNVEYEYSVYAYSNQNRVTKSIKERIITNFNGYSLIPLEKSSDNKYHIIENESKWFFGINAEEQELIINQDKTLFNTFSKYPHISIGDLNYKSGSLSCLLGEVDCEGKYHDSIILVDTWEEFIEKNLPCLYKNPKGDMMIVYIQDQSSRSYMNEVANLYEFKEFDEWYEEYKSEISSRPTKINFSFVEIDSVENAILFKKETQILY